MEEKNETRCFRLGDVSFRVLTENQCYTHIGILWKEFIYQRTNKEGTGRTGAL